MASARVKDGFYKEYGVLNNQYVLLAAGGHQKFGNSAGDIPHSNGVVNTELNADMTDGLHVHEGRNNEPNKIVRTDDNGHIQTDQINLTSMDMGQAPITKIYVSDNGYIKYKTPSNFFEEFAMINQGTDNYLSIIVGSQERHALPNFLGVYNGLVYGNNGFQYFNLDGIQGNVATSNTTPTSAWYHIMRMNHGNQSGYYADIAVPLNDVAGVYWRQIRGGNSYGWYKFIDSNNYVDYLGYIATTPVQATSQAQEITGVTALTFDGATSAGTNYITGTGGKILFGNTFQIDSLGNNAIYLNQNSDNDVYIAAGTNKGKVGIGTTSPNYPLHVLGDSYTTKLMRAGDGFYVHDNGVYYTSKSKAAEIDVTQSNEMLISSNESNIYINKQAVSRGTLVLKYYWHAGMTTNWAEHELGILRALIIYSNKASSSTSGGISLYGDSDPIQYGIAFRGVNTYGSHGLVLSDWATYFSVHSDLGTGWIFRCGNNNYASIAKTGEAYFTGIGQDHYIVYPNGGKSVNNSGTVTGAIAISLPVDVFKSSTMMKITVEIYNYSDNTSSTYIISGYNYSDGNWYSCTAYSLGSSNNSKANLKVRFGDNGSRNIIWIGETDTAWSYPQVYIKDITLGHSNSEFYKWATGWSIDFVRTFGNVKTTKENPATGTGYWANQPIQANSSTTTTPQFGRVDINGSNSSYQLYVNGTSYLNGNLDVNGVVTGIRFVSNVATGTPPYSTSSTTLNTNLNADLLDGYHANGLFEEFSNAGSQTTRIKIGNTTRDLNIDADKLDGFDATGLFQTFENAGSQTTRIKIGNTQRDLKIDADMTDGLHVHSGRNNEANKIVRTDANGYIQAGWINTTSGDMGTGAFNKIYVSNDDYIRYVTQEHFVQGLNAYWANLHVQTQPLTNTIPQLGGLYVINDSSNNSYDGLGYFRAYTNNDWGLIVDKSQSYTYGVDIRAAGGYALRVANGNTRLIGATIVGADDSPAYTFDTRGTGRFTSRLYCNEWIEFSQAYTGLYWPNGNNASHFHPNDATTYGNFVLRGSRGGYSGITLGRSANYMTIMDNGTDKGLYNESGGMWIIYYSRSTTNVSLRTSADYGGNVNINGKTWIRYDNTSTNSPALVIHNNTFSASGFQWASDSRASSMGADSRFIHLIGKENSTYNEAYFGYHHKGNGSADNYVTIGLYAQDEIMNITGYRRVGINTTAPGYRLHVEGDGYFTDTVHVSAASESVYPNVAAIEVRERGRATTGISHNYANAPRIGFHWGRRYWANLTYYDNWFRFMNESCGSYIPIISNKVYANGNGSGTDGGVSLYSETDPMTYGIAFRTTGNYGTLGRVQGDWATYLTMSDTANRGWIFRAGGNYASISARGEAFFVSTGHDQIIIYPGGGKYATGTSTVTGAICITLPVSWTSTMFRFKVNIYNYSTHTSATYTVGGYNYGGAYWVNTFAYAERYQTQALGNLNVRFGHNGTYCCVYIGETNTTWSYPQVTITEVSLGYNAYDYNRWANGWSISFVTSFGTISGTTISNPAINYYAENLSNPGKYYWANQPLQAASSTNTWPTFGSAYSYDWWRSYNATGWYNQSYGGGLWMTDSTWIRTYGSKNFYVQGGSLYVDNYAGIGIGPDSTYGRLRLPENNIAIGFRNNGSYKTSIQYMTVGNEALVFSTQQSVTSFIFKCGHAASNGSDWQSGVIGTPSVQIKQQSLYVNGYIANGASAGYNFYVGGNSRHDGNIHIFPGGNGNWGEGIRIHSASNGWTSLILCGTDNTGNGGTSANSFSLHTYGGNFYLSKNGSSGGTTYMDNINNKWYFNTTSGGECVNVGGWVGTVGANGWYNVTYGGGWWMTDSTYIRAYNGKYVYGTYFYTDIGEDASSISRVYCSQDRYIRAMNINNFKGLFDDRFYRQYNTTNINPNYGNGDLFRGYGTGMSTQHGLPEGSGYWFHIFSSGWSDNSNWISQIAIPTSHYWGSGSMWYRTIQGSNYAWRKLLDTNNWTGIVDGRYLRYSGWWSSGSGQNANDASGMIFCYSNHNVPGPNWGILTTFDYQINSPYRFQLFSNGWTNALWYRNRSADRGGWTEWYRIADKDSIMDLLPVGTILMWGNTSLPSGKWRWYTEMNNRFPKGVEDHSNASYTSGRQASSHTRNITVAQLPSHQHYMYWYHSHSTTGAGGSYSDNTNANGFTDYRGNGFTDNTNANGFTDYRGNSNTDSAGSHQHFVYWYHSHSTSGAGGSFSDYTNANGFTDYRGNSNTNSAGSHRHYMYWYHAHTTNSSGGHNHWTYVNTYHNHFTWHQHAVQLLLPTTQYYPGTISASTPGGQAYTYFNGKSCNYHRWVHETESWYSSECSYADGFTFYVGFFTNFAGSNSKWLSEAGGDHSHSTNAVGNGYTEYDGAHQHWVNWYHFHYVSLNHQHYVNWYHTHTTNAVGNCFADANGAHTHYMYWYHFHYVSLTHQHWVYWYHFHYVSLTHQHYVNWYHTHTTNAVGGSWTDAQGSGAAIDIQPAWTYVRFIYKASM